jgi:hypothetical protein
MSMLRKMIRGGYKRKENDWAFVYTNADIKRICNTIDAIDYVKAQQRKFSAHIIRKDNNSIVKKLFFNNNERRIPGAPQATLRRTAIKNEGCTEMQFCKMAKERKF